MGLCGKYSRYTPDIFLVNYNFALDKTGVSKTELYDLPQFWSAKCVFIAANSYCMLVVHTFGIAHLGSFCCILICQRKCHIFHTGLRVKVMVI